LSASAQICSLLSLWQYSALPNEVAMHGSPLEVEWVAVFVYAIWR